VHKIQIRPACWEDRSPVEALEARIKPYRPEEELQLEPMYARALIAERLNDPHWLPLPVSAPRLAPSKTDSFPEMDVLWVAIPEEGDSLLGIVGVPTFRYGEVIGLSHPLGQEWEDCSSIVELRRLRVAPEWRRQGLGRQLCERVITWSIEHGYKILVVNTTTPQLPARQLYTSLGFRERGISFIGRYELVWMKLNLE